MRKASTTRREAGQSNIELLFIVMFFMMLVGFIRAFVYFELDVFNNTNLARLRTLRDVRGGTAEYNKDNGWLGNPRSITTSGLRNIPFIKLRYGNTSARYRLSPRELRWRWGTKGGSCGIPGCSPEATVATTLPPYPVGSAYP